MQVSSLQITPVNPADPSLFWELVFRLGLEHDREYYENCLERQILNELIIFLATLPQKDNSLLGVGYCVFNLKPKYAFFKHLGIPEIQDINVLREWRCQGIGSAIIGHCESLAREKGFMHMGIGVGLDRRFGPAQRLYVKLGYIPDGNGVSYDRKQVAVGEFRPLDENLCLMMSKELI